MARKKKAKEEVAPSVENMQVTSNKEEVIGGGSAIVEQNEQMKQELEPVLHPDIEPQEIKPQLHVLADDRLNSLIAKANELGITEVVQILNSDKYGQFYMVYRD